MERGTATSGRCTGNVRRPQGAVDARPYFIEFEPACARVEVIIGARIAPDAVFSFFSALDVIDAVASVSLAAPSSGETRCAAQELLTSFARSTCLSVK